MIITQTKIFKSNIKLKTMGNQHVKLSIDQNGLVTSVGESQTNEIFETCIICGKLTDVLINTHIDFRYGYVEGSGQCCRDCYQKTNKTASDDDYMTRTMNLRRNLITISGEEIMDNPNDMSLGAFVRKRFWETFKK